MNYKNYIMSSLGCMQRLAPLALLLFLHLGCQTTSSSLPPTSEDKHFHKDLSMSLGGISLNGLGVLPLRSVYLLELRSRKEPEKIRIANCHRDFLSRDVDDKFSYEFIPSVKVDELSCILKITFLDSKGYHQFGAISFRDDETVVANLSCNGTQYDAVGVSTCQGGVGTRQSIEYATPMQVKSKKGCMPPVSKNDKGMVWEYIIKDGFCLYIFKSEDGEFHKLTTFGYTDFVKQ